MTRDELQAHLDRLDEGVLRRGAHSPGREFCALEFESQVRGRKWSDDPITLPDLRRLNDGYRDDARRTAALLPVMAALWDWAEWTPERQQAWATRVTIETVRQIMPALPKLPAPIAEQCRNANTLTDASSAASAASAAYAAYRAATTAAASASAASAASAAYAAYTAAAYTAAAYTAAAYASYAAYRAATDSKRHAVLDLACQIWITAAQETL